MSFGLFLRGVACIMPPSGPLNMCLLPRRGPRTDDPMCMGNPHEQLFGAALCGIYDDGDEEDGYILCLDNGHVIHLHTAYMYSDPTAGWYRTLHFYTPLRLSDIDYLDFANCITQARMHGARILVK